MFEALLWATVRDAWLTWVFEFDSVGWRGYAGGEEKGQGAGGEEKKGGGLGRGRLKSDGR
ncbi:hypothetical protein RBB79_02085 [Tunturiibacter empetritectus]|uniref:Uncharacterized protein n=1 Tax=Tunturiibacter lichenicola TaxID=2051959 RepID=A0A852VDD5_9BACT|nr:hypothetical protein [Edaphobacter lichenicola]NYF88285.1 hypothetical protein [Edaphobacter lichenicola]